MYTPITTNRFDKDLRLSKRRGKDLTKLQSVMQILVAGEVLPIRYRDHMLIGQYESRRECHVEPDWLLIYQLDHENKVIIFERTGTHSDLF